MSKKCILMFSGGLDSCIAAHVLQQQGIDITALYFVLPFESGLGFNHSNVKKYASHLGIKLRIEEEGEEYLQMVKNPGFGYGKNANPCIDCRIYRIRKAAVIMNENAADFIATGEVVGQRPMSQRRNSLEAIDKRSGMKGLLLRPLSAKLLEPTIAEKQRWVNRESLMAISGRSRRKQLDYAARFGLGFNPPGGGCTLTQKETANRFTDLRARNPDFDINDFKLLAYGRHFRINESCRLIVGRNKVENEILNRLIKPNDWVIKMVNTHGPTAILRGQAAYNTLRLAASITARYSRQRASKTASVKAYSIDKHIVIDIPPARDKVCVSLRI